MSSRLSPSGPSAGLPATGLHELSGCPWNALATYLPVGAGANISCRALPRTARSRSARRHVNSCVGVVLAQLHEVGTKLTKQAMPAASLGRREGGSVIWIPTTHDTPALLFSKAFGLLCFFA
jgi:hypothetical protein